MFETWEYLTGKLNSLLEEEMEQLNYCLNGDLAEKYRAILLLESAELAKVKRETRL